MNRKLTRSAVGTILARLLALALLPGCGDSQRQASIDPDAEHDHEHEEQTARITVWTDRYEVFAEHQPPVAGKATPFITHVTDLRDSEPRREGPVTFVLRQGEAVVEHPQGRPARDGIYLPGLVFPGPGDWQLTLRIPTNDANATVDLGTVRVYPDAHSAAHADLPDPPDGVSFLKEQQWRIHARTEPATTHRLVERLRLPARVSARPGSLARVTPPLPGRLLLPPGGTMPLVGDAVNAGQILALLQPAFSEVAARFVEAEGEVVRAKLALEQAELAFQRIEKLARAEARSGRELQEAEFALKTARAKYDAARALQGAYRQAGADPAEDDHGTLPPAIELRTPIAGTLIAQSGAAIGEFITADRAVFTVLDPATVWIEAHVPEAGVKRLGKTRAASWELPEEPGRFIPITGEGGGRLVSLGLQVDADTRTVPLIYEAKNPDHRLRVGQSLNLQVETARAEETLAIPGEAIVEEGGRPIAFVQVSGETFEKRELTLGLRDGNWVQVVLGISAGERVVTKGAYAVRLASVSSAIPSHGHAH